MKTLHITAVALITCCLLALGCKKSDMNNHTAGMGGVRNWSGVKSGAMKDTSGAYIPYSNTVFDTFAIQIVNDTTIELQNIYSLGITTVVYNYDASSSTASNAVFLLGSLDNSNGYPRPSSITYNASAKTITTHSQYADLYGYGQEDLHTP